MSARHIELWLNSIPCQSRLTLSLETGLLSASIAGKVDLPAVFGNDPSRQSHERWLICR